MQNIPRFSIHRNIFHRKQFTRLLLSVILIVITVFTLVIYSPLEEAKRLEKSGDYVKALKVLEIWPGFPFADELTQREALLVKLRLYLSLKEFENAKTVLKQFRPASKDYQPAVLSVFDTSVKSGQLKFAELLIQEILQNSGEPLYQLTSRLAGLYWSMGRFEEAADLTPRLLAGAVNPVAILKLDIANDLRAARPMIQISNLKRLETRQPDDRGIQLGLARLELISGETESSRKRISSLIINNPNRSEWLIWRDIAFMTGRLDDLTLALEKLATPFNDTKWFIRIAQLLRMNLPAQILGNLEEQQLSIDSLESLAELAALAGDRNLAERLRSKKKIRDQAFEEYRRILTLKQNLNQNADKIRMMNLSERAGLLDHFRVWQILVDTEFSDSDAIRKKLENLWQERDKLIAKQRISPKGTRIKTKSNSELSWKSL
ncbi:MAG: hypothetical protein RJA81_756, partial [Planctomycetota bacterium]